jgi:hypothetical protein
MGEETTTSIGTRRNIVVAIVATLLVSTVVFAASVRAKPTAESNDSGRRVNLTFTKWVTIGPGTPILQGFVGGDVDGKFAGQVLVNQTTDLVEKFGPLASGYHINVLEEEYEVQAGDHSFRALVQGGYDIPTNKAGLDGVVLGGWLTGEKVHVEYQAIPCNPVQPNAAGGTCFQGTIAVRPGPEG